jgi:signal transduction histidine kinase
MAERAALLGGRLTIDASPGLGTLLIAALPLSSGEQAREQEHGA